MGVANPQSWGKEGEAVGGQGWSPFERALVSSYRPSIHIIPLSALVCPTFILGEGEAVGGRGWYLSKERWQVSIDRP